MVFEVLVALAALFGLPPPLLGGLHGERLDVHAVDAGILREVAERVLEEERARRQRVGELVLGPEVQQRGVAGERDQHPQRHVHVQRPRRQHLVHHRALRREHVRVLLRLLRRQLGRRQRRPEVARLPRHPPRWVRWRPEFVRLCEHWLVGFAS